MELKWILLILVILTLIITNTNPSVSLFRGQHDWYDEPRDQCTKCHNAPVPNMNDSVHEVHMPLISGAKNN